MRVRGLDGVQERLQGVERRMQDVSPVTSDIAEQEAARARAAVQSRTSPEGGSWPARKPSTVKRHGSRSSGELASSIAGSATAKSAKVSASAPYAAAVQYGTRTMAARPFLPTESDARAGLLQRAGEALLRFITGRR